MKKCPNCGCPLPDSPREIPTQRPLQPAASLQQRHDNPLHRFMQGFP